MAITAQQFLDGIRFQVVGKYVDVKDFTPEGGDRYLAYVVEYFGGTQAIVSDDDTIAGLPALGSFLYCTGSGIYKPKTGELRLTPNETKPLQENEKTLDGYMRGLMIQGCGQVVDRKNRIINRQPFLNAVIKFQGGMHNFSGLTPEIYNRIPPAGSYCSFTLDLSVSKVRDVQGNTQQIYLPTLKDIQGETLGAAPGPRAKEPVEQKAAS